MRTKAEIEVDLSASVKDYFAASAESEKVQIANKYFQLLEERSQYYDDEPDERPKRN